MASTFTTREKLASGLFKLFGPTTTEDVFLQFVPGKVIKVILNPIIK